MAKAPQYVTKKDLDAYKKEVKKMIKDATKKDKKLIGKKVVKKAKAAKPKVKK